MKSIIRAKEKKSITALMIFAFLFCAFMADSGQCERIKDIVDIQGVRSNPLTGVGLVIGLASTGDSTLLSRQMLTNMLRDSGLVLSPSDFTGGNIAVVWVTAELGPFAREGSRIDVDVSAIGDAKSLQGGKLLPTPLKGLDGQVYAIADGGVSIGGWTATGDQASITKNHQTVGRIPGGAVVEKEEIATFVENIGGHRLITFNLRNSDFSTAEQISKAINQDYANSTVVVDAGTVMVKVPGEISQAKIARFIVDITKHEVKVDVPAVVVINDRHIRCGNISGQPCCKNQRNANHFTTDGAFLRCRTNRSCSRYIDRNRRERISDSYVQICYRLRIG